MDWREIKRIVTETPMCAESYFRYTYERNTLLDFMQAIEEKNLTIMTRELQHREKQLLGALKQTEEVKQEHETKKRKQRTNIPSESQLQTMTNKKLKTLLRGLQCSTSGTKEKLIQRLVSI